MRTRRKTVVIVTVAIFVALALTVTGRTVWTETHRTDLRDAVDVVPKSTKRLAFTDWAAVRRQLDVADQDDPSEASIEKLTSKGYDTDLTAVSSIEDATAALQEHFGFSGATAAWEAFASSEDGTTMVLRMPGGFDMDDVADHLDDLGFTKPSKDTGVWKGGVDLVAAIDPTISPLLQYVAVLADQHLVVTSDDESYAAKAAEVARGDGASLGDVASTREVIGKVGEPAAAMVWSEDFACDDLAMSQADQDSQDQAKDLVRKAGGIDPLSGLVMAMEPDRSLTVAELFESGGQAKDNLRPRAELAVGDAPGRGGTFSDDLTLVSSRTDGAAVMLELRPKEKTGFVLSAVDNGPVLFATC
jgi:hypothetical protein